jgi:hypothetical protein
VQGCLKSGRKDSEGGRDCIEVGGSGDKAHPYLHFSFYKRCWEGEGGGGGGGSRHLDEDLEDLRVG